MFAASLFVSGACASNESSVFNIVKADEKGTFNMGPAVGDVSAAKEGPAGKEVLAFDYSIFKGAIIGVWTKGFPAALNAKEADAVKVGLKIKDEENIDQVSVKLEIKGTKDTQTIPLRLKKNLSGGRHGWSYTRDTINWNTIGDIKEIVFVVSPMTVNASAGNPMWWFSPGQPAVSGSAEKVNGMLYLDLDFYKLSFLHKYFTFIKYALILISGLILGLLALILHALFSKRPAGFILNGFARDILYGIAAVSITAISMAAFSGGSGRFLDQGINFNFLVIALAGALIAEILKRGLTGRHLTPSEFLQNILLTGFLAAASSGQAILQAPSSWSHLFMFNNLIAAITLFIYHISNLCSISSSGRHMKFMTGVLITVTPYLFNWLLLLENVTIPHLLGNLFTFNLLSAYPAAAEIAGRAVIVFIFNEIVTNMISIAIDGKALKTLKAHLFALFVSLLLSVSPNIADAGSTKMIASLPVFLRALACMITTMISYAGLWGEVYLVTGTILDGIKHVAPSREAVSKNVITGMRKGMAYSGILVAFMYALKIILDTNALKSFTGSFPLIVGVVAGALAFPLLKTIIETFDGSLPFFQRARYSYSDGTLYLRGAIAGLGFAYMATQHFIQKPMSERMLFGSLIGLAASGGIS
jgi:cyclic beta-1,2-glucan synthetase